MTQNILNILEEQSSTHLSAIFISNALHATVPAVVAELLTMRKAGQVHSWGSGTPNMFYWSIAG